MMFAAKLSLFALAGALLASPLTLGAAVQKRTAAFFDPTAGGGNMFADAGNGLGEPLNVIISGLSSPDVLTEKGLVKFAQAIGFSTECLGLHLGNPFPANLGDGHGPVNQTLELRQDYGDDGIGTCLESLIGGNHFRVFFQDGPSANSGAAFLAVSKEEPVTDHHTIVPNGYNLGRDTLVQSALGLTSNDGVTYRTTAQNLTGLMAAGAEGVNHNITVDGIVTLLTVTIQ